VTECGSQGSRRCQDAVGHRRRRLGYSGRRGAPRPRVLTLEKNGRFNSVIQKDGSINRRSFTFCTLGAWLAAPIIAVLAARLSRASPQISEFRREDCLTIGTQHLRREPRRFLRNLATGPETIDNRRRTPPKGHSSLPLKVGSIRLLQGDLHHKRNPSGQSITDGNVARALLVEHAFYWKICRELDSIVRVCTLGAGWKARATRNFHRLEILNTWGRDTRRRALGAPRVLRLSGRGVACGNGRGDWSPGGPGLHEERKSIGT
jgi:hypothetical protein